MTDHDVVPPQSKMLPAVAPMSPAGFRPLRTVLRQERRAIRPWTGVRFTSCGLCTRAFRRHKSECTSAPRKTRASITEPAATVRTERATVVLSPVPMRPVTGPETGV